MSRAFGYLALIIAVAAGLYVASQHFGSVARLTNGSPRATVELTGVRNDLMAIAHAERRHMAANGEYVSLEKLLSSGELSMPANHRGPYTYTVEFTSNSFVASATAEQPPAGAPRVLRVDNEMTSSQE